MRRFTRGRSWRWLVDWKGLRWASFTYTSLVFSETRYHLSWLYLFWSVHKCARNSGAKFQLVLYPLKAGVSKLTEAREQVAVMQKKAAKKSKLLAEKQADADEALKDISKSMTVSFVPVWPHLTSRSVLAWNAWRTRIRYVLGRRGSEELHATAESGDRGGECENRREEEAHRRAAERCWAFAKGIRNPSSHLEHFMGYYLSALFSKFSTFEVLWLSLWKMAPKSRPHIALRCENSETHVIWKHINFKTTFCSTVILVWLSLIF